MVVVAIPLWSTQRRSWRRSRPQSRSCDRRAVVTCCAGVHSIPFPPRWAHVLLVWVNVSASASARRCVAPSLGARVEPVGVQRPGWSCWCWKLVQRQPALPLVAARRRSSRRHRRRRRGCARCRRRRPPSARCARERRRRCFFLQGSRLPAPHTHAVVDCVLSPAWVRWESLCVGTLTDPPA